MGWNLGECYDLAGSNGMASYLHLAGFWQLKALGMEGMTKELIQYLRTAEKQFLYRSTYLGIQIYNTVLHSLVEAKEVSISWCLMTFSCIWSTFLCIWLLIIIFLFSV